MRLDVKALALAGALLWGGALLLVGLAHLAVPGYGAAFLGVMASVYPGFGVPSGVGGVLVGTVWGLVDGALSGMVLAWLYNLLAGAS